MSLEGISHELAEVYRLTLDAFQAAKDTYMFVTDIVPDSEDDYFRDLVKEANCLANKYQSARKAHETAPFFLSAAVDGSDAHEESIEYSASVLASFQRLASAHGGNQRLADELAQAAVHQPFTASSIGADWDALQEEFTSVDPPDETIPKRMWQQVAKAEVLRLQTARTAANSVPEDAVVTMDGLQGRSLRLFRFLNGRSHKTYFDELRDDSTVFTKANITDEGIATGIKDLIKNLEALESPYHVEWSKADRWVKLHRKPKQ